MTAHEQSITANRQANHYQAFPNDKQQCSAMDGSPERNIDKPPLRGGFTFFAAAEEGVQVPPALPKLRGGPDTGVPHTGASTFCLSGVLNPLTLKLAAGRPVWACPQADGLLPKDAAADGPAASGWLVGPGVDSWGAGTQDCAGLSIQEPGL